MSCSNFYNAPFELGAKRQNDMKYISHTNAQRIIDIACASWKDRLADTWGKAIVKKQEIAVTKELLKEMRSAANDEQTVILNQIFGKDEPTFKKGDWVYWSGHQPIVAQIIKEKDNDPYCWVLSVPSHNSCHENYLRLATKEEIENVQDIKAGEWIIITDFGRASRSDSFKFEGIYKLSKDFNKENGLSVEMDCEGNIDNGWGNAFELGIKIRRVKQK